MPLVNKTKRSFVARFPSWKREESGVAENRVGITKIGIGLLHFGGISRLIGVASGRKHGIGGDGQMAAQDWNGSEHREPGSRAAR